MGVGNGAHLTAAKVQVQIAEVAVEGEALEKRPVVGKPGGPPLPLPCTSMAPLGILQLFTHPT